MDITATITGYNISLWIHITAVVVGLGATFAESILLPAAAGVDKRHIPVVHRIQIVLNRYFANPALLVILITGLYQVSEGNWDLGSFWISSSIAIVILIGGINGMYFIPTDKKLGAMITEEIAASPEGEFEPSEEYNRLSGVEGALGAFTGVLVIAAIFLMVIKPGA
ncbi:MAG: DUF2269 family protein [Solirubrobacterales bacterium]|nr:DUF2269 family protein [Solirubrobacterales bacterium]